MTTGPRPTPTIEIATVPGFPLAVRARLVGYSERYDLWWGDHKGKILGPTGSSYATHLYSRAGGYAVAAYKTGSTAPSDCIAQRTVAVRGAAAPLGIELVAGEDGEIAIAQFLDVEDDTGVLPRLRIGWPDGTTDDVYAVPGQQIAHYLGEGDHTVVVHDVTSGLKGTYHLKLDGIQSDPDFTMSKSSQQDEHTRTAQLRLTRVSKPVLIYWGDEWGEAPQRIEAPEVGQTVDHTYATDGSYPVLVMYEDGTTQPELGLSLNVTVPWSDE